MRVLKRSFIAWFYTVLFHFRGHCRRYCYYLFLGYCCWSFDVPRSLHFCSSGAAENTVFPEGRLKPAKFWLCRALCQTIIFCTAICRRPLQMIDMLNRTSGPHINRQAHSWVRRRPPSSSGMEWNNICLLHQGLVYPLPTRVSCVIARGN